MKNNSNDILLLPAVGLFCILNLIFILLSHANDMMMDDGHYMLVAVQSFDALTRSVFHWFDQLFTTLSWKAPLLWWIGQFFVPLGKLLGSVRIGLLLVNILVFGACLILMYKTILRATDSKWLALCGILILAGSPLLNELSTEFWREPLQQLVVIYAIFIMVSSRSWSVEYLFFHSIVLVCLALLTKAFLLIAIGLPLMYITWMHYDLVSKGKWGFQWSAKHLITMVILFSGAFLYYKSNGVILYGFAQEAAFSGRFNYMEGASQWELIS